MIDSVIGKYEASQQVETHSVLFRLNAFETMFSGIEKNRFPFQIFYGWLVLLMSIQQANSPKKLDGKEVILVDVGLGLSFWHLFLIEQKQNKVIDQDKIFVLKAESNEIY